MVRLSRIVVLALLSVAAWAVGAAPAAAPVSASQCGNGSSCPPDVFGPETGTLLASVSGTITASGSFTAHYTEAVYSDHPNTYCSGCLNFDLQISNDSTSIDPIQRVTVSNFSGTLADIGYTNNGASAPGGLFTNGSVIPSAVARNSSGAVISWDFTGTNGANEILPGQTSMLLEVQTPATTYTAGLVSAQNGGAGQNAGFQPVAPSANIPEAPWVPAFGLLGGLVAGGLTLRRRRGIAPAL